MNWRKYAYLSYASVRGYRFPSLLALYRREYEDGTSGETTTRALVELLRHCRITVPYYGSLMREVGEIGNADPRDYLRRLPILTKQPLRVVTGY